MYEAFRYELDPNRARRAALAKHVGTAGGLARAAFGGALERGDRIPNAAWNRWKRENGPWWVEVSEALRDLEWAGGLPPRWAGRARKPQSLADNKSRLTGSIRVFPRHVKLASRSRGRRPRRRRRRLRTKEPTDKLLRLLEAGKAKILSATISWEADRCEVLARPVREPDDVVGVDLGLCAWTRLEPPKPLKKAQRLLRRQTGHNLPKQIMPSFLSRKQKGSKNYRKAALRSAAAQAPPPDS